MGRFNAPHIGTFKNEDLYSNGWTQKITAFPSNQSHTHTTSAHKLPFTLQLGDMHTDMFCTCALQSIMATLDRRNSVQQYCRTFGLHTDLRLQPSQTWLAYLQRQKSWADLELLFDMSAHITKIPLLFIKADKQTYPVLLWNEPLKMISMNHFICVEYAYGKHENDIIFWHNQFRSFKWSLLSW